MQGVAAKNDASYDLSRARASVTGQTTIAASTASTPIVGLVNAAEVHKVERLERKAREREWRAAEERRLLEIRRREEEAGRIRALDHVVTARRRSRLIRDYVAEVRATIERAGNLEAGSALAEWLRWAEGYANRIDPLLYAAWHGYVHYEEPWPFVLPALAGAYAEAIARTGTRLRLGGSSDRPDERLAEHLMELYWRGAIDLSTPGNLIEQFFARADGGLRAHAIRFIGRALIRTPTNELDSGLIVRLVLLWDWRWSAVRSQAAAPAEVADELVAFGAWFASRAFEPEWAGRHLRDALAMAGRTEPVRQVVAYLAELAPRMPMLVAECLRNIDTTKGEPWRISLWEEAASLALQAVLASDDPGARRLAESVVGRWVARGHTEFPRLVAADQVTGGGV
jgi:hypothetical protein